MDHMDFPEIFKRQQVPDPSYDPNYDGYYLDSGDIARYAIVAAIIAVIVLWVIVGHLHARHRVKKGLEPMLYHRWLVPRRYRPQYARYGGYTADSARPGYPPNQGEAYHMSTWNYAPPPPVYSADAPPQYAPPPNAPPSSDTKGANGPTATVQPVAGEPGSSNTVYR